MEHDMLFCAVEFGWTPEDVLDVPISRLRRIVDAKVRLNEREAAKLPRGRLGRRMGI